MLVLVVVLAACSGSTDGSVEQGGGTWTRLDLEEFSARSNSFVVPFGEELLVFGGLPASDCPANADCTTPAAFFDGKAFALDGSRSRQLSDIPVDRRGAWTTTKNSVFILSGCVPDQGNCTTDRLVRYSVALDHWDTFDVPAAPTGGVSPGSAFGELLTVGDDVVFISELNEPTQFAGDLRWDTARKSWDQLPVLNKGVRERRLPVDIDGELVIFTSAMDSGPGQSVSAYRYDEASDSFVSWPIPDLQVCRTAAAGHKTYLFPRFDSGTAPGGQYDASINEWTALPPGPGGLPWNCGLMGVLETQRPTAAGQVGWVYQHNADVWTLLEHPVLRRSVSAERVFVYDGKVVVHAGTEHGEGSLWREGSTNFGGTWVWLPNE